MKPRKGASLDYDEDKRRHCYETYLRMCDNHSDTDIAHSLGITPSVFYNLRRTKWWKEKESNNG